MNTMIMIANNMVEFLTDNTIPKFWGSFMVLKNKITQVYQYIIHPNMVIDLVDKMIRHFIFVLKVSVPSFPVT